MPKIVMLKKPKSRKRKSFNSVIPKGGGKERNSFKKQEKYKNIIILNNDIRKERVAG